MGLPLSGNRPLHPSFSAQTPPTYAWHEPETGFVHFEVSIPAAAQSLRAAYESGTADLDYVAYEQAVDQAVRGTPGDETWLHREFARLLSLAG